MGHIRSLENLNLQGAWLTIGAFDGVHRGHRAILERLSAGARAQGAPAVVLTFSPHPIAVLRPERQPLNLTSADERASLLLEAGADYVITYRFDHSVARRSARDFLLELKRHLGFAQFWVGHDFAMGRDREGDISTLRKLGRELDYQLTVIDPIEIDGEVVSSSRIRRLLAGGEVEPAARMLGRPYRISGQVVLGDRRGRTIGVPTANLQVEPARALPGNGVYACRAHVNGQFWQSVTNIGVRPTFEVEAVWPFVEAHLLNFSADIYGEVVDLEFIARLRGERKFSGVDALISQIKADITQARGLLEYGT